MFVYSTFTFEQIVIVVGAVKISSWVKINRSRGRLEAGTKS